MEKMNPCIIAAPYQGGSKGMEKMNPCIIAAPYQGALKVWRK